MTKINSKTLITTFGGDIYIIEKTPDEVTAIVDRVEMVRMPNGSYINKKSIASMQSYDDYTFQVEQKNRHKKGQYLKSGEWFDGQGSLGITAGLERVTGNIDVKRIGN